MVASRTRRVQRFHLLRMSSERAHVGQNTPRFPIMIFKLCTKRPVDGSVRLPGDFESGAEGGHHWKGGEVGSNKANLVKMEKIPVEGDASMAIG